jgi:two-component system, NtrC family, sensor kinase
VTRRKNPSKPKTIPLPPTEREVVKVLIVGGEEALDESGHIIEALLPMGLEPRLIGVVVKGWPPTAAQAAMGPGIPVFDDYKQVIKREAPDLLVITSEDYHLRKHLLRVVPPQTRIVDSFVLSAFRTLRMVSGQLGTAQHRLESVELVKEALLASSDVSIMEVDEDFNVREISNTVLKRTKLARKDCIGRGCYWVIHRNIEPCHVTGYECGVRDVLETGRLMQSVREDIREDGSTRYFTISWYPLREDERGKRRVLIIWKDVTKGIEPVLDKEVGKMKENISQLFHQDRMTALGRLAAAAVHEINNPMQGILTFAKLLKDSLSEGPFSKEQLEKFRSYLDLIASESQRCGHILRNLLSFARDSKLQKSRFDLHDVLDEILLLINHRLSLQNISIQFDVAPDLPRIYCDRDQIKQALLNLILNAIEAMPNGGRLRVSAGIQARGNKLRIRVSDTGPGIPKEIQTNVFEPFVTTKEEGRGVGLGLSVVYGIIAQHGGSIEVDSDEGKGATFTLSLPLSDVSEETQTGRA